MSKVEAQKAHDQALAAKNQSESARNDIQMLIDMIDEFLSSKAARPADVRAVSILSYSCGQIFLLLMWEKICLYLMWEEFVLLFI